MRHVGAERVHGGRERGGVETTCDCSSRGGRGGACYLFPAAVREREDELKVRVVLGCNLEAMQPNASRSRQARGVAVDAETDAVRNKLLQWRVQKKRSGSHTCRCKRTRALQPTDVTVPLLTWASVATKDASNSISVATSSGGRPQFCGREWCKFMWHQRDVVTRCRNSATNATGAGAASLNSPVLRKRTK